MNQFLAEIYVEHVVRLAIGVEPVDWLRGTRVPPPLLVVRDMLLTEAVMRSLRDRRLDVTDVWPTFDPHDTCRHVLRYGPGIFRPAAPHVDVRLVEGPFRLAPRRFVPRRLRIPLVEPAEADARPAGFRIRRPGLYPGAAYPVHESATGLRGCVMRGDERVRWARVEARAEASNALIGRAHGDDRGEFFLILTSEGSSVGEPQSTISVRVEVFGPATPPESPDPIVAATDPLWDLPLETLPDVAESDPVVRGETRPWPNEVSVTRPLEIQLGRISSERKPFVIP